MVTTPRRVDIGSRKAELIDAINALVDHSGDPLLAAGANFTDTVTIEKTVAGPFTALQLLNDSTNAAADVLMKLVAASGAAGDPYILFTNGTTTWVLGLDNSDSDALVGSLGAALGVANFVRVDATSRDVVFAQNFGFMSNTAFKLSFDHAATADRQITIQDLAGTMALLGANNVGNLTTTGNLTITGTAQITSTATVNGEAIAKTPIVGVCTGSLTLTTSYQDITGCTTGANLTPGYWLICGTFYFGNTVAGDLGALLSGQLVTTGGTASISNPSSIAQMSISVNLQQATISQHWIVSVTATTTAKLQAEKSGGAGTSLAGVTHSTLVATFLGKP